MKACLHTSVMDIILWFQNTMHHAKHMSKGFGKHNAKFSALYVEIWSEAVHLLFYTLMFGSQ